MRKLIAGLVVAALVLLFASCGGDNSSTTAKPESRAAVHVMPPRGNVSGNWERWEGTVHEEFVTTNHHRERPYSRSRFIVGKKDLRLKLNPEATLVWAEVCYDGVDLFCEEWDGPNAIPLIASFTDKAGKKYRIHLVSILVEIKDPEAIKPTQSEQAAS